jgi:hypothetical protein
MLCKLLTTVVVKVVHTYDLIYILLNSMFFYINHVWNVVLMFVIE